MSLRWSGVAVAIFLIAGGAESLRAQDPVHESIPEARLARLLELNAAGERDSAVTNAALLARWPKKLRPQAIAALDAALQLPGAIDGINSGAIGYFVEFTGGLPTGTLAYLNTALPEADAHDKVRLLSAIRALGPRAIDLKDAVRVEQRSSFEVVAILAASAMLRIDPEDPASRSMLDDQLRSDSPDTLWRTVDAIGRSGYSSDRVVARLRDLLSHEDVRVRVTAAAALWRLTGDETATLPALRQGLIEEDVPLAIGFVFPSYLGPSHKSYVLGAMSEMRRSGVELLEDLTRTFERAAEEEANEEDDATLALTALIATANSGVVSVAEFERIERMAKRGGSIFQMHPELTRSALEEFEVEGR